MKSVPLPVLGAVALLCGAGGGALTALALRGSPDPAPRAALDPLGADPDSAGRELRARLGALEAEQRALLARLASLELRPTEGPRTPAAGFVPSEQFEALREEVRAALDGRAAVPAPPEELRQQVAGALEEIRHEEQVEAVRAKQEARVARIDQDLARLERKLELAPHQVDGMRQVMLDRYQREAELVRLWQEGADPEFLSETKTAAGARFREDVERVLAPDQVEVLWRVMSGKDG